MELNVTPPQITRETWDIQKVVECFHEKNPRIITSRQLENLRNGIKEFGFLLPVVINTRTNKLIGGHQRVKAAQLEGVKEIEVNVVDLDPKGEMRLMLALNKIDGKWDYQLLEEALSELSATEAIVLSGFNESDLVEIMSESNEGPAESFEEFTERFSSRKSNEFVTFRSASVFFTCSKTSYEALIQKLYSDVGVDDIAASFKFFQLIGLGK